MSAVAEVAGPTSYALALPEGWVRLDLDPTTQRASVEAFVAERVARSPGLAPRRRQMRRMLLAEARAATEAGAVDSALLSEVIEGLPVTAALAVSLLDAPASTGGTGSATLMTDLAESWGRGGAVSREKLPNGPAVRLRASQTLPFHQDGDHRVVETVQFFVPTPAEDLFAVLSFSTPTLEVVEELVLFFDAIAGSFAWVWAQE